MGLLVELNVKTLILPTSFVCMEHCEVLGVAFVVFLRSKTNLNKLGSWNSLNYKFMGYGI